MNDLHLIGKLKIPTRGDVVLIEKTITQNGGYNAEDDGANGYSEVLVALPFVNSKSITSNGTHSAESDNARGFKVVNVNVPYNLGTKTIDTNGTYNASSDNKNGYSQVTVNVPVEVSNPIYDWWTNEQSTLVVRKTIKSSSFRWYFNYYNVEQAGFSNEVPHNLQNYIKNNVFVKCKRYENGEIVDGMIGFNNFRIGLYNADMSEFKTGVAFGIMESTDTGTSGDHQWEEPTYNVIIG